MWGCGPPKSRNLIAEAVWKDKPKKVTVLYAKSEEGRGHQSSTGHVKPGVKQGGPPPKAKYYLLTDREEYREGKVKKKNPWRGVKENLKPYAYKQWERK